MYLTEQGPKLKIRPLVNSKSLRVVNLCAALLMGYYMQPGQIMNKTYKEFLQSVQELTKDEQAELLLSSARLLQLNGDEILDALAFVEDPNGLPIDKTNIGNFGPDLILDMIVAVCLEALDLRVFFCPKTR